MKLISLTCKNFKKLAEFTARFTDGLNVISGENAQGKSTLLQAVEAALFGVTVVPGKKENIPTWGQSAFSLTLTFEVNHSVYELTRTKSSAKLIHVGDDENGGVLVANGNTAVTGYIEDLLGLTAKDWNLFVQSKQGETAGVLTFGATALNQKVEEFAGVSLIDEVARKAQERAGACRAQAESYAVPPEDLHAAKQAVHDAVLAADLAQVELAGAKAHQEAVESEAAPTPPAVSSAELHRQRRAADLSKGMYAKAAAEETAAADALVLAEADLAAAEKPTDASALAEIAVSTKAEMRELKRQASQQQEHLQRLLLCAAKAEQAEREYADCPVVLESDLEGAEEALEAAGEALQELNSRLSELCSRRRSLESLARDALCPTCGTRLSEHDPETLKAEISASLSEEGKLLELIAEAKKQASDRKADAADAARARSEYLRLKAAVEAAIHPGQMAIDACKAAVEDAQARHDALHAKLATVNGQVEIAESVASRFDALQRRVDKAAKRLRDATQEREEAEARITDGPSDELIELTIHEERQFEQARHEWQTRRAEAKAAVTAAEADLKAATALQEAAQRVLDTLQVRAEKAAAASSSADQAARLARFLRERRQAYLKEVWDGVLGLASQQVRGATGGQITRIAYDAEFQFEEEGVLAPVSSASGAQKAFIGTALRIGLARALYGHDSLLIFDEPTEAMSERNAAGLAASLTCAGRQTLLITHREHDQALAANLITL